MNLQITNGVTVILASFDLKTNNQCKYVCISNFRFLAFS